MKETEAARAVLLEVLNALGAMRDDLVIVGGRVPDLLYPSSNHMGSSKGHGPQRDTGFVRAVRAHPFGWKASGLAMDCGRQHLLSTGQRTNSNSNYPPE